MTRNKRVSLIVAAIDLLYGFSYFWKEKRAPDLTSMGTHVFFLLAVVAIALGLIWYTDDMLKMTDIDPYNPLFYNTWSNLNSMRLKLAGWVLLLIFIPAGVWFSTQIGK